MASIGAVSASADQYTIKSGDTMSEISQTLGVDMNLLAQHNNIANIDLIYAGETIMYDGADLGHTSAPEISNQEMQVAKQDITPEVSQEIQTPVPAEPAPAPEAIPQGNGSLGFLYSQGATTVNGVRMTWYNPQSLGWSGSSIQGGINIAPGADGVYRDGSGNIAVAAAFNIPIGTVFSSEYGQMIVVDHCGDQHYDLVVNW